MHWPNHLAKSERQPVLNGGVYYRDNVGRGSTVRAGLLAAESVDYWNTSAIESGNERRRRPAEAIGTRAAPMG